VALKMLGDIVLGSVELGDEICEGDIYEDWEWGGEAPLLL
jgi:hypothetical protein